MNEGTTGPIMESVKFNDLPLGVKEILGIMRNWKEETPVPVIVGYFLHDSHVVLVAQSGFYGWHEGIVQRLPMKLIDMG